MPKYRRATDPGQLGDFRDGGMLVTAFDEETTRGAKDAILGGRLPSKGHFGGILLCLIHRTEFSAISAHLLLAFHALSSEVARVRVPGWAVRDGRVLQTDPPNSRTLVRVRTGVGLQRARNCAKDLPAWPFAAAVLGGFAGSLVDELPAGSLLIADRVSNASGQYLVPPLAESLEACARRAGLPVQRGPLVSVADVVSNPRAKRRLAEEQGARAVDMESFALAEVLADRGIEFGIARVVLDGACESLPAGGNARSAIAEITRSRSFSALASMVRIGARVRPCARLGAQFLEAWLREVSPGDPSAR